MLLLGIMHLPTWIPVMVGFWLPFQTAMLIADSRANNTRTDRPE